MLVFEIHLNRLRLETRMTEFSDLILFAHKGCVIY